MNKIATTNHRTLIKIKYSGENVTSMSIIALLFE